MQPFSMSLDARAANQNVQKSRNVLDSTRSPLQLKLSSVNCSPWMKRQQQRKAAVCRGHQLVCLPGSEAFASAKLQDASTAG